MPIYKVFTCAFVNPVMKLKVQFNIAFAALGNNRTPYGPYVDEPLKQTWLLCETPNIVVILAARKLRNGSARRMSHGWPEQCTLCCNISPCDRNCGHCPALSTWLQQPYTDDWFTDRQNVPMAGYAITALLTFDGKPEVISRYIHLLFFIPFCRILSVHVIVILSFN